VTPLEALWAATTQAEADQARTDAWSSLTFPITVGDITITGSTINLPVVEFTGTGGTLDWPLRLIGAPLGVRDPAGMEIDPDGLAWRTDPEAVLLDVVGRYA
jgi:hypothetical protein